MGLSRSHVIKLHNWEGEEESVSGVVPQEVVKCFHKMYFSVVIRSVHALSSARDGRAPFFLESYNSQHCLLFLRVKLFYS